MLAAFDSKSRRTRNDGSGLLFQPDEGEAYMAQCKICGAETSLFLFGTPICVACEAKQRGEEVLKKAVPGKPVPEIPD